MAPTLTEQYARTPSQQQQLHKTPQTGGRFRDTDAAAHATYNALPESVEPYSDYDISILSEILTHAESGTHAEPNAIAQARRGGKGTGEITLQRLLKSYESVLPKYQVNPHEDIFYYRFLLKLSLDPNPNWWAKFHAECSRFKSGGAGLTLTPGFGRVSSKYNQQQQQQEAAAGGGDGRGPRQLGSTIPGGYQDGDREEEGLLGDGGGRNAQQHHQPWQSQRERRASVAPSSLNQSRNNRQQQQRRGQSQPPRPISPIGSVVASLYPPLSPSGGGGGGGDLSRSPPPPHFASSFAFPTSPPRSPSPVRPAADYYHDSSINDLLRGGGYQKGIQR